MKMLIIPALVVLASWSVKADVNSNTGANYNNSHTKTSYTQTDKALALGQYLVDHDHFFRQLESIFYAYRNFSASQPKSSSGGLFQELVLSRMPYFLRSKDFKETMSIITDELNRVDTKPVSKLAKENHWLSNSTNVTNALIYTYQHQTNFKRMIQRILMRKSARMYFPYNKKTMPNIQCYEDTMDFMDSLVGGQYPTVDPHEFNLTSFWWAINMFDSIGKPAGGITKGNLYYIGSYDECINVEAVIPANIYIGNIWRTEEKRFSTKFCRAQFNISDDFVKNLNVDTRGIKLKLNWGICVPASCRSNDVAQLLTMGPISLPVNRVSCVEKPDLETDASAIIAIAILCVFGLLVVVSTIAEAILTSMPVIATDRTLSGRRNQGYLQDDSSIIKNGYAPDTLELQTTSPASHHLSDPSLQSYKEIDNFTLKVSAPEHPYQKQANGDIQQANGHKIVPLELSSDDSKALESAGKSRPQPPVAPDPFIETSTRTISPFIRAFSALTNIPKLTAAKKSANSINCVHGIRFVSMLWIILGHTYNYGVVSDSENPTTANLVDVASLFERFSFQAIIAAGFAVDTFFLLSAFLVTYLTLKDLSKKKVNGGYMIMYYFHRFWRLTPLYMIVLMAFSCLYQYFGDGPLWPEAIKAADYCKTNWWTNLLYVNNLVQNQEQCLGWSWYLADDMQFYVASPIFIFTLFWYAPVGIALTVGFCIAGVASAFYEEYVTGGDMFTLKESPDYWQNVYTVPWTRMAAWMVGIILGWVMYKTDKIKTIPLKKAVLGWCLAIGVGVFISYITYTFRQADGDKWPAWLTSLYESVTRPLFAACVAWVIFACHHNRGGIINDILSWNGIIPLSRLTYAAYLLHPTIMIIKVYSQRSLVYISDFDVAYLYMGHTCMTFMIAFVFSVCFEAPFLSLEKILFPRGR